MLYIFHGSDISKSSEKARSLINSLRIKKPDAAFVEINPNNWSLSALEENIGGQGLFSSKYIILLNQLFEEEEIAEKLLEFLPALQESDNIFIVSEGKVTAELKKSFEKNAEKVVVSDRVEAKKSYGQEFNIFSLADALGAKERFKAWSIYREAIQKGLEPEKIIGTIFWQLKSMALASKAKSVSEAGLNPFVYSKSKRYAANYSVQELNKLLKEVIVLYHDGHRGMVDMEMGVERMLLLIK